MKRLLNKLSTFLMCMLISVPTLGAFHVPSSAGKVRESVHGTNGKTIYLVEEAHADYGAQKALAAILNYLARNEENKLILVEGGWGNVSLSYLRTYGSEKGRLEIAEKYLREGKISGEEYLDVTTDLPIQLIGVEKEALYAENMKAFLSLDENRLALEAVLQELRKVFESILQKIFSPEILEFLNKREGFYGQSISMTDYLHFLKARASKEVFDAYPALSELDAMSGEKAGFDSGKVQLEKQELIASLSRILTQPELEALEVLESNKTMEGELASLKNLILVYERYPQLHKNLSIKNLKAYGRMLKRSLKMDSGKIFSEIENLEEKILMEAAKTETNQKILGMMSLLETIEKLFRLQLTPKDFEKLSEDPEAVISGLETGLNGILELPDMTLLRKMAPAAQAFYLSARKRETALFENAAKEMEKSGEKKAAMIIGGFHSKNLFENFSKAGYTVFYVSPHFEVADGEKQHRQYLQILKSKWQHFELVQSAANQNDQVLPLQSVKN